MVKDMRDHYELKIDYIEPNIIRVSVRKVLFCRDIDAHISIDLFNEEYTTQKATIFKQSMNEEEKFIGVKVLYHNIHQNIEEVNTILKELSKEYSFPYTQLKDEITKEKVVNTILDYLNKEPEIVEYVPKNSLWPTDINYYVLRYDNNNTNFMLISYDTPEEILERKNKSEYYDYIIRITTRVNDKRVDTYVSAPDDKYNIFEKMMKYWNKRKIIK